LQDNDRACLHGLALDPVGGDEHEVEQLRV
jgi:hypothetical protein